MTKPRRTSRIAFRIVCLCVVTAPGVGQLSRQEQRDLHRQITFLELSKKRVAAARKILRLGARAVPSLLTALNDPRPEVVCRLAIILRMLDGDARPAIPTLRKIAKSANPRIRTAARWALGRLAPRGNILYADFGSGSLVELGPTGKTRLEIDGLKGIWGVSSLPNGNFLVALCSGHVVQEIDRKGKVVWESKAAKTPVYAVRLPGDHTLIVDASPGKVLEVDTDDKVVWSFAARHPTDAMRLPNGNTLVTDFGNSLVVEVDPQGEVVWRFEGPGAMDAERLANGNTLVALAMSIVEVDPQGKKVLEIKVGSQVEGVCRTPDGRTIAVGPGWVYVYDKVGKRLQKFTAKRATCVEHN